MKTATPIPVAVLASGGGSNLQALIDHFGADGASVARIALVVSDRSDAGALARAQAAGIPAEVIAMKAREPEDVGAELLRLFERHQIGVVALAGFLKLVPAAIVRRYPGRIVNIHPALLPAFGGAGHYGLRVHRAVIDAGARISGPTVHLVDEDYDTGRILAQWPVPVLPDDTPERLAARVLAVEHVLYPVMLEALAREMGAGAGAGAGAGVEAAVAFAASVSAPTLDEVRAALRL